MGAVFHCNFSWHDSYWKRIYTKGNHYNMFNLANYFNNIRPFTLARNVDGLQRTT